MNRKGFAPPSYRVGIAFITVMLSLVVAVLFSYQASAQNQLVKLSQDNFTNGYSEHKSEVEPDAFAWGATIVSAFQVARVPDGGGADIGWATSQDGGKTWKHGNLPGLTQNWKNGSFYSASDAAVAYDAKHKQWLISSLPILDEGGGLTGVAVAVSRSSDGIHWGTPVIVAQNSNAFFDKNWITCDSTKTSPHYGNCYTEWDMPSQGDVIYMSTSTDGGKTWGSPKTTADQYSGLGGQPLVQPNGTVVVPVDSAFDNTMDAFRSTDGGNSWTATSIIGYQNVFFEGNYNDLRNAYLPSARIDHAGKIYVVWPDCSFRSGCSTNDLVMTTSTDGQSWSALSRIPIDPLISSVDHFLPGLGIDRATSGNSAHLTVTYYYYPQAGCSDSTCQLYVGFTTSTDGGNTWTAGQQLAGPMQLSWLPDSQNGLMVADYLGTAYSKGNPFGVFAVANAPSGGNLHEAMYTTQNPLSVPHNTPRFSSKGEEPLPDAKGTFVRKYYDDDGKYPIPPEKIHKPN